MEGAKGWFSGRLVSAGGRCTERGVYLRPEMGAYLAVLRLLGGVAARNVP